MFCAGGMATKAGVATAHTWFHAQKTTPKAIAIAAATTMSTVRHVQLVLFMSSISQWLFEDEERTVANRDRCGQRRDLVAQAPCASEPERVVRELETQSLRGDAVGVAVDRQ